MNDIEELNDYVNRIYEGEVKHQDSLDNSLLKISVAAIGGIFVLLGIDRMAPHTFCEKVVLTIALCSVLLCIVFGIAALRTSVSFHAKLRSHLTKDGVTTIKEGLEAFVKESKKSENRLPHFNTTAFGLFLTYTVVLVAYAIMRIFN
ncbi:MAG: hypothetical protein IPH49_04055 [Ignavibacteria bacterium]|nr:hypothetical protein [Ignavibacteria bacterium]